LLAWSPEAGNFTPRHVLMLRLFFWTDGYFAPKFLKGKTKMRLCKKYLHPKPDGTCRAIKKRCAKRNGSPVSRTAA
jgi:hypothetical protein